MVSLMIEIHCNHKTVCQKSKGSRCGVILTISSQKTKQSNKNKIAQIKYRQNKHTFDENERASETF